MNNTKPAVPIRPAASLILLRPAGPAATQFEVLLLLRAAEIRFAGGVWVFPGGRIETDDAEGGDLFSLAAAKRAAVRECEEEAGLRLPVDELVYYAHWTTPEVHPKRYATWFFLDALHQHQDVLIDKHEIVDHRWLTPEAALAQFERGELKLMPPAFRTLMELRECANIDAALRFARERPVPQILPLHLSDEQHRYIVYPEDAAYASRDLSLAGARHRLLMHKGGGWEYICEPE